MGADPPELSEDVDLDLARRRYVLDAHARLAALSHYDLLGVSRNADKKEIKRAYFGLAATVHPDRYFGKRLGTYKAKMEMLFARITVAFETLQDAEKRARYDATLPAAGGGAGGVKPAAPPRAPVDPKVAAKRQEAMDALKARFADGKGKAKQLAETAARARAAGDLVAAAEAYRQALAVAPNDPELKAAYEDVQKGASKKLVESYTKKAQLEERFGQWAQAADTWKRVLEVRPDDAEARDRHAAAAARAAGG